METLASRQARKIMRADKKGLLHPSAFDYACSVHPGPNCVEETPYKAERRVLLCQMIDVAIDHRIRTSLILAAEVERLNFLKGMDK